MDDPFWRGLHDEALAFQVETAGRHDGRAPRRAAGTGYALHDTMTYPLTIHTALDHSSPLHTHIERSLARAIRPFAPHVDRVEVWLSDANGRKHGPADKLVRVVLTLVHGGQLVAAAASDDFYASVGRAAARIRHVLARRRGSARSLAARRQEVRP